jgi:hypothetical protein
MGCLVEIFIRGTKYSETLRIAMPPEDHEDVDPAGPQPLGFDEFKHLIDTRGGYPHMETEAMSIEDFKHEFVMAASFEDAASGRRKDAYEAEGIPNPQYVQSTEPPLPDLELRWNVDKREPYVENNRSESAKTLDNKLMTIKKWLVNPLERPVGMNDDQEYRAAQLKCDARPVGARKTNAQVEMSVCERRGAIQDYF